MTTPSSVREPAPGEVLGHNYLIERELGRGGFGVVYKARHADIDRVVAVKVMLATYAARDPSAKDRFRREATIAASLSYPNSLRIFDYGETDEGVFYLVMEYVSGGDLGGLIRREGKLSPERAVHIVRQVLFALSEAHARGIVHRDIKPDNVMICPVSYDPDFVKVMDFGIAKMVDSNEAITKAGLTLGTPRYMPVEQLKGERLAPTTDLYAVGLVLYEMLVGRPAFESGESAVDTALVVMRGDSVSVPVDAGVPPALAAVVEKAAAKNAEDRYPSARAFLDALDLAANALTSDSSAQLARADATKTQAVPIADILAPRDNQRRVDHGARTEAIDVVDEAPPRPRDRTETAMVTSAVELMQQAEQRIVAAVTPKPPPADKLMSVVVGLQVAAVVLLLVLLLR